MTLQYATILFLLSFYTILVVSADLTSGMANLLAFCQAAFCGIGAYLSAFFLINCHLPFLLLALVVMLATGLCGILVSFASMRLKGDYFAPPASLPLSDGLYQSSVPCRSVASRH